MTEDDLRRALLARIEQRRAAVLVFVHERRPRTRRLATITIVLTSLAAILTAGPAMGGEKFSSSVQKALSLPSDSYVWRALCLGALIVSVAAALVTNIGRSQEGVAQLSTAEATGTELEGLVTLLQFGHLSVDDAAKLYHQYTSKIPFVDDVPVPAGR